MYRRLAPWRATLHHRCDEFFNVQRVCLSCTGDLHSTSYPGDRMFSAALFVFVAPRYKDTEGEAQGGWPVGGILWGKAWETGCHCLQCLPGYIQLVVICEQSTREVTESQSIPLSSSLFHSDWTQQVWINSNKVSLPPRNGRDHVAERQRRNLGKGVRFSHGDTGSYTTLVHTDFLIDDNCVDVDHQTKRVFTREKSAKWSFELRIIEMTVLWPVCTQISVIWIAQFKWWSGGVFQWRISQIMQQNCRMNALTSKLWLGGGGGGQSYVT